MVVAYALIVGFSQIEALTGFRLPTSKLATAVTSQTYAVTSVFTNQNDLATYLSLCWPFLLCAFFFTRRAWLLALTLLLATLGALAFVRTGSRSSLMAVGIESVAAVVLLVPWTVRTVGRTGKLIGLVAAVGLLVGAGVLLFNESDDPMLRQFRLEALLQNVTANKGSGQVRTDLTDRGLHIAGASLLLGAGPGQSQVLLASGTDAARIANLHDWWLETYAEGGLVAFGAQMVLYVGLLVALWPLARRHHDPLLRYLASGTWLALLGFTVGALGPSSSLGFTPMWALYGLGLAVVAYARRTVP